jgi:D-amino-acid dehydrogenase
VSTKHVIVIGAGMVGLSTAWHLQRGDVEVSVVDRKALAAGASSGNAGWLTPALVLPLAEPELLRSGLVMIFSPKSPLYIPPTLNPQLLRFLAEFTRHCTRRRWRTAATALAHASSRMYDVYDEMVQSPVAAVASSLIPTDRFLAAFASHEERAVLVKEFERLGELGFAHSYTLLDPSQTRGASPVLGDAARFGISIEGQRFLNPSAFVHAIGDAVIAGGGQIHTGRAVSGVDQRGSEVVVSFSDGSSITGDAAVIATGSWLAPLARKHGVRKLVQAGRGYSFTVYPDTTPDTPLYLPAQRVACTPLGGPADGLRIAGMMEFRAPDAPLDPRRIQAIIAAASTMLTGIDWSARTDEWVGPRPCTSDGLPLIGRTMSSRVFVAGGHGMWGIALGPLTGKLLAQQIVGAQPDPLLLAFDPLRP